MSLPTTRPLVSTVQQPWEVRQANTARHTTRHEEECFICGRGLTEAATHKGWSIWLGTDGTLLPVLASPEDVPTALDQGWFPVGSECAKRVPLEYRMRTAQAMAN